LEHFPQGKEKEENKKQVTENEEDEKPKTEKKKTRPSAYRAFRCALAAHNFSRAEIIRAMDLLLEAHIQLVSTQLDGKLVIEEAITKIARKSKSP
jgi:DNA polymerase III delta subunit